MMISRDITNMTLRKNPESLTGVEPRASQTLRRKSQPGPTGRGLVHVSLFVSLRKVVQL